MRAMRVRLVLAFALLATVVGAAVPSMAPGPAGAAASLFPEAGVYSQAGPGGDPTIIRASQVSINLATLDGGARVPGIRGGGATTLTLNLFPGVTLTAGRDSLEPNTSGQGFIWLGHVQGAPQSQVTLVVENGVMAGNIRAGGAYYQVRYVGGGQHAIYEIDPLAFPEETHARLPVREEVLRARAAATPPVSADTGSTIDVMILYTATAANEAGGGTGMDTQVDLGITETNTAYANSGVTPRLRLVYKGQVDYAESGTNVDADLVSLQSGRIPNAAALREQYGADIVSLWVGGTYAGVCGVAYVMNNPSAGFADFAFNVVVRRCATGNFSLGHEIGHILGACHDWIQDGRCGSQFAYAHGHVAPNNAFRTIMSYASSCTDSAHPTGCPRIQYFSNPNVTYQGQPVGAAGGSMPADNRQVFNQTAAIVANFRQCTTLCNALSTPIVPTPTPPPTATPASTPTATPAPVCTPRPDVSVSAVPGPNGTLQVTVTANSSTGVPNIRITALQFGAATNALVDVAGRTGVTGNTTVTLPSPAAQVSFVVRRAAAGQATTVPLTVMDSCGGWPTLVGGGPGAF